mmetsp:Transcript_14892/g.39503  ORF Transcript_14892/g.39503 Transcript_14892/m.39503 type:complete len:470 (+) Transcript_14892:195-1604(+)
MVDYNSFIESLSHTELAAGHRAWALRLLRAAEAKYPEEVKLLGLADVRVRNEEGPPTIEDTTSACEKLSLMQLSYYRHKYTIPRKVLDAMSPFGTLHVFDSWVHIAEQLYTSAVYMVYLIMHHRAGVFENAKSEPLCYLELNQRDPADVPSKLALQVLTIAETWDKIRVDQQGQDVKELLRLLQFCWAHALNMQDICVLQLNKFLREHQQQKQPRASRGRQRASSSQRPADRRAHAQPESKAEAFDQTRAAAQEVICGWEKTVDACAWCVHVILSRLAYPLPYPCMAGFLPLATGTMQVLSQPGSFRMRGLLRPHDTRSANPGSPIFDRVGGAIAAASVGSFLLDLPHPQRKPQLQQQEGPSHLQPLQQQQQQQKQQQQQQQEQGPLWMQQQPLEERGELGVTLRLRRPLQASMELARCRSKHQSSKQIQRRPACRCCCAWWSGYCSSRQQRTCVRPCLSWAMCNSAAA